MLHQILSFPFPLLWLMFSLLSFFNADSNIYLQCSQLYFNSMTPYESNVNSLFTSLVDSATVSNFNKFQISQSDVIYGLYQCQGDLSSSHCKDCVTNGVSQLKSTCRVSTSGTIQLQQCFVKYDNRSFFGVDDKTEVLKMCGPSIGYNSDVLNHIDDAMAYLVTGNGQYFHATDFGSIQGVAQCVQDLSLSDCQDCLLEASGRLRSECDTSTWGYMYLGKCYIRYVDQGDDGHAYNINTSYKNSNNNHDGGKTNNIVNKVLGYLAAAVVGGGATSIAITVSIKWSNKNAANKQEAQTNDNDYGRLKILHKFKRPIELIESMR